MNSDPVLITLSYESDNESLTLPILPQTPNSGDMINRGPASIVGGVALECVPLDMDEVSRYKKIIYRIRPFITILHIY